MFIEGKNLVDALKNFKYTNKAKNSPMENLIDEVSRIKNLDDYVTKLTPDKLDGEKPVFSTISGIGDGAVRMDLYWKKKDKHLHVSYNDSDPYRMP